MGALGVAVPRNPRGALRTPVWLRDPDWLHRDPRDPGGESCQAVSVVGAYIRIPIPVVYKQAHIVARGY